MRGGIFLLDFINKYIFGPGLCISVFGCGIFLLFYLRFFFIAHPRKVFSALRKANVNGMSPAKAMCVALAGTLGVGNIAGVASAITVGGPGAVFWMLVSSVAALPLKYSEVVLAMLHRRKDRDGKPHGGAFFYISDRGTRLSSVFAAFFAVLCLITALTMGSAIQSNAISVCAREAFGTSPVAVGAVLAVTVLLVASGGLSRISFFTSRLIPLMSGIYIAMSLFIILTNLTMLPDIFADILDSAFDRSSAVGGVLGFITSKALRVGVTRGTVSNEAGCGTAPIAHAGADSSSPAAQGIWGMAEVFIDTVIICTLTALTVLIAERHGVTLTNDGMADAVSSYARFIPFARLILAAAVFVFAFCTVICWFHYGSESLSFLTGKQSSCPIFLVLYSLCTFLGALAPSEGIWSLCDASISLMTAVNITALMLSAGVVKAETEKWLRSRKYQKSNINITKIE